MDPRQVNEELTNIGELILMYPTEKLTPLERTVADFITRYFEEEYIR